jgi:hypothetical protein
MLLGNGNRGREPIRAPACPLILRHRSDDPLPLLISVVDWFALMTFFLIEQLLQ